MKKIIAILTAATLCVAAYAKTLDVMMAEMPTDVETKAGRDARLLYVQDNKSDIVAAFNAWKDGDDAKFLPTESANAGMTAAQEISARAKRKFFAAAYWLYGAELTVNDNTAIRTSIIRYYQITGDAQYRTVKSSGWQIDGVSLPGSIVYTYASVAKDKDFIQSLSVSAAVEMGALLSWSKNMAKVLPAMGDTKAAYDKSVAIETALMASSAAGANDALKTIRDVQDTLYLRLTRANKIK